MKIVLAVLGVIILALIVATFTGSLVWFMWSNPMVDKFHLPDLTWWECVKLSWICALLFKATASVSKD